MSIVTSIHVIIMVCSGYSSEQACMLHGLDWHGAAGRNGKWHDSKRHRLLCTYIGY